MSKFKVKVSYNKGAAEARFKRDVANVKQSRQTQDAIGDFLTKRIRSSAKAGKPLNKTGNFPELADLTKKNRKFLEQFNDTTTPYRSAFSNLSFTGQLLDAIRFFIDPKTNDLVVDVAPTERKPYKTKSGKRSKTLPPDNKKLAEFLEAKGFIIFDEQGLGRDTNISNRIKKIITERLRRLLKDFS